MSDDHKPLAWFHGEIKTPPMSHAARVKTGFLLRKLQQGELISLPWSRPLPSIEARCHELRITDETTVWRLVYCIDSDAMVILDVFKKKTQQTPKSVIDHCKRRIRLYDAQ